MWDICEKVQAFWLKKKGFKVESDSINTQGSPAQWLEDLAEMHETEQNLSTIWSCRITLKTILFWTEASLKIVWYFA